MVRRTYKVLVLHTVSEQALSRRYGKAEEVFGGA
jgi:hypothetical protein